MKKLISAVTSLCMAASMVSAVVPATVGAADASKGFAIKTYDISKPSAADAKSSITINKKDIPADGYVIPSAVYYSEGTNKTDSLLVAITTDSKDISFALHNPTKSYTDEEKSYTLGGDTFETDNYISFAGSYDDLDGYAAAGKYVFGIDSSQSAAGTDNYFIGCSWTNNGKEYAWAGEKSDSYPFYVFDAIVPQNIAAGTYTINFCEYNTDASGVNDNPSPLVEGEKTRFTTKGGNLKLETMTIKVTADGEEEKTTASTTTTSTTSKKDEEKTTTTTTQKVQDGDIQFTFADKNGSSEIEAKAGDEITIYANVKAGGKAVSAMDVQFAASNGLTITKIGGKSTALDGVSVSTNIDEYRANFTSTGDDGEPIVPADGKAAFTLQVKVPDDAKDASYTIGFADQCKVFKDSTKFNYSTSFAPATIKVSNGEQGGTTKTTSKDEEKTTTTTTTTNKPVQDGDIQFTFADKNGNTKIEGAKPGDEITVYANVKAGGKEVSAMDVQFAATKGLTITKIGGKSTALDGVSVSTNIDEYRANFTSTGDDGEPIVPADGKAAFTLQVKVDDNAANGTYTIGFADQCKVFKDSTKYNYSTSFAPLEIVVGETETTTTTTTTTSTTSKKDEKTTTTSSTTTTSTTSKKDEGTTTTTTKNGGSDLKQVWGDANEDGEVNVCDVVLVLTYIADPSIDYFTEQGKVNADVAGDKGINSEDSDTLVKYCLKKINKPA